RQRRPAARRCQPGVLLRHGRRGRIRRRARERRDLARVAGGARPDHEAVQEMMGQPLLPPRPAVPPLRTVLFVPGTDDDKLEKAAQSGADAIILDLEEPQMPMTDAV